MSDLVKVAEYLRARGWQESFMFAHTFTSADLAITLWTAANFTHASCSGPLARDQWTLGERRSAGIYAVTARGFTLAELTPRLEQPAAPPEVVQQPSNGGQKTP